MFLFLYTINNIFCLYMCVCARANLKLMDVFLDSFTFYLLRQDLLVNLTHQFQVPVVDSLA